MSQRSVQPDETLADLMQRLAAPRVPLAAVSGLSTGLNKNQANVGKGVLGSALGMKGHPTRLVVYCDHVAVGVQPTKLSLSSSFFNKREQPIIDGFELDEIIDCVESDGIRDRSLMELRVSGGLFGAAFDSLNDRSESYLTLSTRRGDVQINTDDLQDRRRVMVALAELICGDQELPPPPTGYQGVAHELKALAELRDSGVLTQDESHAQKARLLHHPH